MSNFFTEMVRSEPHSIDEIRASIYQDLADHKQLIPILKDHHDYIQESVSYLLDKDSTEFQKQEHLERFFRLVGMHAKSEEETLYKHLKNNSAIESRIEGLKGKSEHDIVFNLEAELNHMNYKNVWTEEIESKAKLVALQIKNHINEEEDEMFSIAESHMTQEELEEIRDEYIQNCIAYLDNETVSGIHPKDGIMRNQGDYQGDSFH